MTPTERRARVRALKAEARAWRRAAELVELDAFCDLVLSNEAMKRRNNAHWDTARGVSFTPDWWTDDGRVLACLLLALECEDEAKEAGRG